MKDEWRGLQLFVGLLLLVASFILPVSKAAVLAAEGARIEELAVINSEQDLLFYCLLRDAFSPEMEQGVKNGIPVSFNFFVELYQTRDGGGERKVIDRSFSHIMTYDSLKEQFTVELEEHGGLALSFQELEEARSAMNRVNDFHLVELAAMEKRSGYVVRVRARLAKKDLPLNFQYIMPFGQLWTFETDWKSLAFSYGKPGSTAE
ncbi:MAG: DUF4390 domain-containing protein [Thermodesulfobacteriota bacterium]